jgi:hypothetical protein
MPLLVWHERILALLGLGAVDALECGSHGLEYIGEFVQKQLRRSDFCVVATTTMTDTLGPTTLAISSPFNSLVVILTITDIFHFNPIKVKSIVDFGYPISSFNSDGTQTESVTSSPRESSSFSTTTTLTTTSSTAAATAGQITITPIVNTNNSPFYCQFKA